MSDDGEFGGTAYDPTKDKKRLRDQLGRVRGAMFDGMWRTLEELSFRAQAPQASVSARIRDLRKPKFGGYCIERRLRQGTQAKYEYRINFGGHAPSKAAEDAAA